MKSRSFPLVILIVATTLAVLASPFLGVLNITLDNFSQPDIAQIFWSIRVPRVLVAFGVGSILAVCGLIYQMIFRNPLASPYTLGVSSGAALGATAMMFLPLSFLGTHGTIIGGIFGAVATIAFISFLGFSVRGNDTSARLLLSGVILSFFISSMVLFLQYLADFSQIFRMTRWLMGSVEVVGYATVILISITSLVVLGVSLIQSQALSVIAVDADFAQAKGIAVTKVIIFLFIITSLAIGIVVTFCGPIGFIGVAVPYIARSLIISNLRNQLLLSYWCGGCLLVACDTFSRIVIAPAEIPVGVVTALIASPFVMAILMRSKAQI